MFIIRMFCYVYVLLCFCFCYGFVVSRDPGRNKEYAICQHYRKGTSRFSCIVLLWLCYVCSPLSFVMYMLYVCWNCVYLTLVPKGIKNRLYVHIIDKGLRVYILFSFPFHFLLVSCSFGMFIFCLFVFRFVMLCLVMFFICYVYGVMFQFL